MKQNPDRAAAVDYILGITREIWEDRGLGPSLRRHYAEQVLLRHPGGVLVGNEAVLAATLQTLHEFPDRRLLGEDVIWQGAGEDGTLTLGEGDVLTLPKGLQRRLANAGPGAMIAYVTRGGDSPSAPQWAA